MTEPTRDELVANATDAADKLAAWHEGNWTGSVDLGVMELADTLRALVARLEQANARLRESGLEEV